MARPFGGARVLLLALLPLLGTSVKTLGMCDTNEECESGLCLGNKCCTEKKGGLSPGCMRCGSNGGCVRCDDGFDLPGFECIPLSPRGGNSEDDDGAGTPKKKKKKRRRGRLMRKKKKKKKKKKKEKNKKKKKKEEEEEEKKKRTRRTEPSPSPSPRPTGPCESGGDCESGRCLGGKCCTEKGGLSDGCKKCGSNGGCVKCEAKYALPGFVCIKEPPPAAETGPCEHDDNCASGVCLGGKCCTVKGGLSNGCKKCGSDGGCLRCKKGFSLPGSVCVAKQPQEPKKLAVGTCSLDVHCASEICLGGHCCAGTGLSPGCGGCEPTGECATCVDGFELRDGECFEGRPRVPGSCERDQDCDLNVCKGGFCCQSHTCTDPSCHVANANGECARCGPGFRLDGGSGSCIMVPRKKTQQGSSLLDQRNARPAPEYVDIFMPNYEDLAVEHADDVTAF